ncbi:MAG: hypothetical protein K6F49_06870 [Saccharofermentans sp.]|nr:hypothetical protein [Saccharofermentans sp.]
MDDFQKYLVKQMDNEKFRKEYESLEAEYLEEVLILNKGNMAIEQK